MEYYKTLEKVFSKLNDIEQVESILAHDSYVTMPKGSADFRALQMATLSSIKHAILCDQGLTTIFEKSNKNSKKLNQWQSANFLAMQRMHLNAMAVPNKLLKKFSEETSKCEIIWREAKAKNDFKMLVPSLKKVVSLVREKAKVKAKTFKCSAYDALLQEYDQDCTTERLDELFKGLSEFFPDFLNKVLEKQKKIKITELKGPFPVEKQKSLSELLLERMEFDMEKGRLDETAHPQCIGFPGDLRITTKYCENNFLSSYGAVMHEAGHAMYESGLPKQWLSTPVGKARSYSLHESQSLFMEVNVGRSREFIKYIVPHIKKIFSAKGRGWSVENIFWHMNKVTPSLIRVHADEVTYIAHIMIRYQIEKYLINGDMEVEQLPEAWKQGMEKFLGVVPENDAEGCMQDIHWMMGDFGYFPTYLLGSMYASRLFVTMKESNKNVMNEISKGKLGNVICWLNKNVHSYGSLFSSQEILKKVSSGDADLEFYKEYLTEKYLNN